MTNHTKSPMHSLVRIHRSAPPFLRAISSPAILLTTALMGWTVFSGPVTAAMLPDTRPNEWPADPAKHQVAIRRETTDDTRSAMISAAEAAQPSKAQLRKAADAIDRNDPLSLAQPKEAPLPASEKAWWYKEQLSIRIPFAITADAVAYYSELVGKYGKQAFNRHMQPSSRLDYRAGVKFHKEFNLDDKTFHDVHVVTLNLTSIKASPPPRPRACDSRRNGS